MTSTDRRLRWAGVAGLIGPTAFISCWVAAGVIARRGTSPSADAISRLAAAGADTRWMMTTGFIAFGVGVGTFASALRIVLDGRAWMALAATSTATLLVATAPLDVSGGVDRLHGAFAAAGYVTLVAAPLLAADPLRRRGFLRLATAGRWAAGVAAAALALSIAGPPTGLLQRVGLTVVDLWLLALAASVASGRLGRVHDEDQERVPQPHVDARSTAARPTHAGASPDADTRTDTRARATAADPPTRPDPAGTARAAHPAA